jgi:hypothetical protein
MGYGLHLTGVTSSDAPVLELIHRSLFADMAIGAYTAHPGRRLLATRCLHRAERSRLDSSHNREGAHYQFPSRCRTIARLCGFLILSQCLDGPDW